MRTRKTRTAFSPVLAAAAAAMIAGIACLGAAPSALAAPPPVEKPSEDKWFHATSEHLDVYSDQKADDTQYRTAAVEDLRYFLEAYMPTRTNAAAEPPLKVYFLDSRYWLMLVRPDLAFYADGVYFGCREGVSLYSAAEPNVRAKSYRDQDQSQLITFHEYTHHVMFHNTSGAFPKWYIEGLADYYSTLEYDGDTAVIGEVPWGDNAILNRVNWSHFETVLDPDNHMGTGLVKSSADLEIFYAKAWLLTHYMMSDADHQAQLKDYFERLSKGEKPVPAFEASTGIKINDLPGILRTYSRAMKMQVVKAHRELAPVTMEPMDRVAPAYLLLGSAFATCPEPKLGQTFLKVLKQAVLTPTDSKKAAAETEQDKADRSALAANLDYKLAVAYGELLYGDPEVSLALLNGIGPEDSHYGRAQYLLGRLYLKRAAGQNGDPRQQTLVQARDALTLALKATPGDPPTEYFLAHTYENASDRPSAEAVHWAEAAYDGAPSVYDYAEYAADVALLQNRPDDAATFVASFATDPHSPKRNGPVTDALAAIKAGKPGGEIIALLKKAEAGDEDAPDAGSNAGPNSDKNSHE